LPLPKEIKVMDNRLLMTEATQLRHGGRDSLNMVDRRWEDNGFDPLEITLHPWTWAQAEVNFVDSLIELEILHSKIPEIEV
jgi:hypothetical protein